MEEKHHPKVTSQKVAAAANPIRRLLALPAFSMQNGTAPLPAYEAKYRGVVRWFVWCRHCQMWHDHGPAEGHREAHCRDRDSPYWKSGYNLALAGKWRSGPKDVQ